MQPKPVKRAVFTFSKPYKALFGECVFKAKMHIENQAYNIAFPMSDII